MSHDEPDIDTRGSATGGADVPVALRVQRYFRDVVSGTMSAVWMLAYMLTLALIAFGPLGDAAIDSGVRAAFAAAIFGNVTAAILGSALLPNEVPRASTVLVFASFVTRLAHDCALCTLPGGMVPNTLFLAATCLALSGLLQIAFGLLRLGNIARYVPYPVVAGFMTGLALTLAIYELPELMGLHGHGESPAAAVALCAQGIDGRCPEAASAIEASVHAVHAGFQYWPLVVGVATIGFVLVVSLRWSKAPSRLVGILLGTALAALILRFVPGASVGPSLPSLSGSLPWPDALLRLFGSEGFALLYQYRFQLVASAAVLAVVGSLDSLLSAVGEMDGPLESGHEPNRLLITLGFGNIASALFGGVPVAYSSAQAMATSHQAGRKTIQSLTTSVALLLLLLYGGPLLAHIPVAVFAGVNITIAIGLFDRWARDILQRVVRQPKDRELRRNLMVVAFVAGITVMFGPVPAVAVGLVLSMGLFIAVMNRSLVRSTLTGETRASRRIYPPEEARLLRERGRSIVLVELDGAIFFGTAERLGQAAAQVPEGTRFLILDLHRVTMIDASGALTIEKAIMRLHERGIRVLLAHISTTSRLGSALIGAGLFTEKHHPDWFEDVDRALEWAERQVLAEVASHDDHGEIPIGAFALMRGLSPSQLEAIKPYLDRQRFPARSTLFREGDVGDRLYLLARGAVSIVVGRSDGPGARARRVVTLAPGVIFGESAALKGEPRAVTAVIEEEAVAYSLSRQSLDSIRGAHPDLYVLLLQNLLQNISAQLRTTAGVVRETGDTLD